MKAPKILLSSLSSKIALYDSVLRQAKFFNNNSSVIGADCNPNCPGAHIVKRFKMLPPLIHLNDNELLNLLLAWGITHILPTRDGELKYWADKATLLLDHRIKVLISSSDTIRLCEDKFLFSEKITESCIRVIPSFNSPPLSKYEKWVVKERRGSGTVKTTVGVDMNSALKFASNLSEPIFQPYISGREFSAEAWINKKGEIPGVTLRWRDKVLNGESHISTTFENYKWAEKIKDLFKSIHGLYGHCLGQFIVDRNGILNLIEINPRLGGASPLSLNTGLNSIMWSLQEETYTGSFYPIFDPIYGARLTKIEEQVFISL